MFRDDLEDDEYDYTDEGVMYENKLEVNLEDDEYDYMTEEEKIWYRSNGEEKEGSALAEDIGREIEGDKFSRTMVEVLNDPKLYKETVNFDISIEQFISHRVRNGFNSLDEIMWCFEQIDRDEFYNSYSYDEAKANLRHNYRVKKNVAFEDYQEGLELLKIKYIEIKEKLNLCKMILVQEKEKFLRKQRDLKDLIEEDQNLDVKIGKAEKLEKEYTGQMENKEIIE